MLHIHYDMEGACKIIIECDTEQLHLLPDFKKIISSVRLNKDTQVLIPLTSDSGKIIMNLLCTKYISSNHLLTIRIKAVNVVNIEG